MTYRLTIEERPTYLHAVVTGENSAQNVERYMEELMCECASRGVPRLLLEERLEGPRLGAFEIFGLVSRGTVRFQRTLEAMAYVDVNVEGDLMRFAENVAVNRGFPVRVFPTVAAAQQWLLHEYRPGGAAP